MRIFLSSLVLAGLFGIGMAVASPTTQPVNTICPVSGEAVDPAFTTQYDGKTIGFCCKDCPAKFEKDPQKYMKDLK
ncbi:MAG TPA: YHS domain-containing protein [Tepidisphaeraceae bacterium]|jgi:YHS domain-containing protein|nr:YHS domain-containing protein [Tepidisphaeraceae bacterium]